MREEITEIIPQHLVPSMEVSATKYNCDSCGKPLQLQELDPDSCLQELIISLNQDECVNFLRIRDYCPACLDPVWGAVNKLIGADPDAERDRDYR